VIAELLGRHGRYADFAVEARFHSNPRGLPDLLAGEVTLRQFMRKLRRFWWYRVAAGEPFPALLPRVRLGRSVRGLHKAMPRRRFDRAVEKFPPRWERDPLSAGRRLFLDLLWPTAARAGKPGLVEMTTSTVEESPALLRLFPEAKFVHCIRDGRDSGSSKVAKRQKPEHPRDAFEGLGWWVERLERNERAIAELPADRILHLSLDQLVAGDRETCYRSLLEFLGIDDEPAIRDHFETEVTEAQANRGRWRRGLDDAEQADLAGRYERVLEQLSERGFASAPILDEAYRRLG